MNHPNAEQIVNENLHFLLRIGELWDTMRRKTQNLSYLCEALNDLVRRQEPTKPQASASLAFASNHDEILRDDRDVSTT